MNNFARPPQPPLQLQFPPGINAEIFLRDYWQRRPLLMRGLLPGVHPVEPDELAGLACDPRLESRLIAEQAAGVPWEVRHGPFEEADFTALGELGWTLLVQDLDKFLPAAANILEAFDFLPSWRIDDLMVSYAADQGSVGPHEDAYDVFLLQTQGRRLWQIDSREARDRRLVPGLDLRILSAFDSEQQWLLEPGDCLYLPPGVAHWGVAQGACITCSVGFRSSSLDELLGDWLLTQQEWHPGPRYNDPTRSPPEQPARLTGMVLDDLKGALVNHLHRGMSEVGNQDPGSFAVWFGCHVTRQKENLLDALQPPFSRLTEVQLTRWIAEERGLTRSLLARMAFYGDAQGCWLFVNGEAWPVAAELTDLIARLCASRRLPAEEIRPWLAEPAAIRLLLDLFNGGWLVEKDDDPFA